MNFLSIYRSNLCLDVWMSDHNSLTDLPYFFWGNSEESRERSYLGFKILSLVGLTNTFIYLFKGGKAKIVNYDQVRVNGWSNYENPGQRWVPKLVLNKIVNV